MQCPSVACLAAGVITQENPASMVAETQALELAMSALARLGHDYVDVAPHIYEMMSKMAELSRCDLKCLLRK